jgi:aminoglycoside phosphotransferase (APT) family kinase protein
VVTEELPGIDLDRTTNWLLDHLESTPPLSLTLIAAGGSNLTFRVTDAEDRAWALRRPPEGRAPATAHDVDREWRILSALDAAETGVPVPRPLARCRDTEVTGSGFFVMEFVDGRILRTVSDADALEPEAGRRAAESLVAVQTALHAVDVDEIGLGDLGRRTGYVERQLRRWRTQVERAGVRELPALDDLHRRLVATVPADAPRPALVHGDYRFDNVVLGADHSVAAVLDWELCTLGDPVADACWSLLYWADPADADAFLPSSPTLADTIPDRAWAAGRYERLSGRSLESLPWFTTFGWWKMACVVEGVYARRLAGARGGGPTGDVEAIAASVDRLLEVAEESARAVGV